ncbi:hypothetical protein PG995_005158 [Apiospora arundinis]
MELRGAIEEATEFMICSKRPSRPELALAVDGRVDDLGTNSQERTTFEYPSMFSKGTKMG